MTFITFMSHMLSGRCRASSRLIWLIWGLILFTGSQGTAQVLLPPQENRYLLGEQEFGVIAITDIVLDFMLPQGSLLSGTVQNSNGSHEVMGKVMAEASTEHYSSTVDMELASYRMIVPDNTYQIFVETRISDPASTPPAEVTVRHDLGESVTVVGDTTYDIVVPAPPPLFTVMGDVVASTTIDATGRIFFEAIDGMASSVASVIISQGQASYRVRLPAGEYNVRYQYMLPNDSSEPPIPLGAIANLSFQVGTLAVSADEIFDVALPEAVMLSGTIQDDEGVPAVSALVMANTFESTPAPTGPFSCQVKTPRTPSPIRVTGSSVLFGGTGGMYGLPLIPASYEVFVTEIVSLEGPPSISGGPPVALSGALTFPVPSLELAITTDQRQDFTVSNPQTVIVISGMVVDDQGTPVPGAFVTASTSLLTEVSGAAFGIGTITGANGDYRLPVYHGSDYTVTVCPSQL